MPAPYDPAVDPILCSPFDEPHLHWRLDERGRAERGIPPLPGRRPPTRLVVPEDSKPDAQKRLDLDGSDRVVNPHIVAVRKEVRAWREADYPQVTFTTRALLHHWTDPDATTLQPFFAQVEAIETLIWLREVAPRSHRLRKLLADNSRYHNDGLVRLCSKMATGTGKTAVMGMLIAWQTLNAVEARRSRNVQHTDKFAVITPGHTVRERLAALLPAAPGSVYDEMGLVPHDPYRRALNQAHVRIVNFQAFTRREMISDTQARRALGHHRGNTTESTKASVRRVLEDLAERPHPSRPVCVINDEAHHCYLPAANPSLNEAQAEAAERQPAIWFNAIREMRAMGLLGKHGHNGQESPVYDFSATPLWINSPSKTEPPQFGWVCSDFGLMDAIESGLVKVPRVPVDDDSEGDETQWRNLYKHTRPKRLDAKNTLPPPLRGAVEASIADWRAKFRLWRDEGQPTPPVLIFVVDKIANAAALWEHLAGTANGGQHTPGAYDELSNHDPQTGDWRLRTLLVHSQVNKDGSTECVPAQMLREMIREGRLPSKTDAETAVRAILNTIGKPGTAGADIRCVVSVQMLTEGWDARTVTNIVGYRQFGTQLLCEQVTGRALRRTSYDAFRDPDGNSPRRLEPEYAEVVGVPFEFMPDSRGAFRTPTPPKPRTRVQTIKGRSELRVRWPNVLGYLHIAAQTRLAVLPERAAAWQPPRSANAASMSLVEGVAGPDAILSQIADRASHRHAQLRIAERMVEKTCLANSDTLPSTRASLFRSAFRAVRQWSNLPQVQLFDPQTVAANTDLLELASETILAACTPSSGAAARAARLSAPAVSGTASVSFETTLALLLAAPRKSELSHAACHSKLELAAAEQLDAHPRVRCWVRNFRLGWTLPYHFKGAWRRYEPDFVATLTTGEHLIVECKGVADPKSEATRLYVSDHWIPCVRGTSALPDDLRVWGYAHLDNPAGLRAQLEQAITALDLSDRAEPATVAA